MYCPDDTVSRAQMATFLVKAFNIDPAGDQGFTDIDGHTHEHSINALAATRITDGCTTTTFCPDSATTRSEMATFIVRACNKYSTRCAYDDRIGSGRLSVLAGPSMGTARIARTPGARDAVEYLGDRGGYDVFIYEVCDRLRNCHSAEATVAVRAPGAATGL